MKPNAQISRTTSWKVLRSRSMPLPPGAKSHHIFFADPEETSKFQHRQDAEAERERLNAVRTDPLDRFVVVRVITAMELDDDSLTEPKPPS